MRRCVIVRGLPGSGKSTLSRNITAVVSLLPIGAICTTCCTDDYFMHSGEYKFNGLQLTKAHDWNRSNFKRAIDNNYNLIVVDNTNTQFWEMAPYIEGAINNRYELHIAEPTTDWAFNVDELFKRNTHGVPREAIEKMLGRWENIVDIAEGINEKYKVKCIVENNFIKLEVSNV